MKNGHFSHSKQQGTRLEEAQEKENYRILVSFHPWRLQKLLPQMGQYRLVNKYITFQRSVNNMPFASRHVPGGYGPVSSQTCVIKPFQPNVTQLINVPGSQPHLILQAKSTGLVSASNYPPYPHTLAVQVQDDTIHVLRKSKDSLTNNFWHVDTHIHTEKTSNPYHINSHVSMYTYAELKLKGTEHHVQMMWQFFCGAPEQFHALWQQQFRLSRVWSAGGSHKQVAYTQQLHTPLAMGLGLLTFRSSTSSISCLPSPANQFHLTIN